MQRRSTETGFDAVSFAYALATSGTVMGAALFVNLSRVIGGVVILLALLAHVAVFSVNARYL